MLDFTKGIAQIALILALAILGHGLLDRAIPRIVRVSLSRRARTESTEELAKRQATLSHVVRWASELVILAIVALTILAQFDINIMPALASLGIAGIAIGFGAQTLVRDIISGLFVLIEDQYRVGDVVRIVGSNATVQGTVEEINLRRTLLRDQDGVVHSVPNGEVRISSNLTREWGRVNIEIPVAYGTDLDRVREVIDAVGTELANDPLYAGMITEPPHMERVERFDEAGVVVRVVGVTRPARHWEVAGEFRWRLLVALPKAGIGLPYSPRVDLQGSSPHHSEGEGSPG